MRNNYMRSPLAFQQQADQIGGLTYGTEVMTYVPLPIAEIGKTAEIWHNRYEEGYSAKRDLDALMKKIRAHEVDQPYLKEVLGEYEKEIKNVVKDGRFESNVRKIKDISSDFTSDERIEKIQTEKQKIEAIETAVKAEAKALNAPPGWAEYEIYKRLEEYKKSGGLKAGAKYSDLPSLTYTNPQTYIDNFLKNWKSDTDINEFEVNGVKTPVKRIRDENGNLTDQYMVGTVKYNNETEMRKALAQILKTDNKISNSLKRELEVQSFLTTGKGGFFDTPKSYDEVIKMNNISPGDKKMLEDLNNIASNGATPQERADAANKLQSALNTVFQDNVMNNYIESIIDPQIQQYAFKELNPQVVNDTKSIRADEQAFQQNMLRTSHAHAAAMQEDAQQHDIYTMVLGALLSGTKGDGQTTKKNAAGEDVPLTPGTAMNIPGDEQEIDMEREVLNTTGMDDRTDSKGAPKDQPNFKLLTPPSIFTQLNTDIGKLTPKQLKEKYGNTYRLIENSSFGSATVNTVNFIESNYNKIKTGSLEDKQFYNAYIKWKRDNPNDYNTAKSQHWDMNKILKNVNEYRTKTTIKNTFNGQSYMKYKDVTSDKYTKLNSALIGTDKQNGSLVGQQYFVQGVNGRFKLGDGTVTPKLIAKGKVDGISYGDGGMPAGYVVTLPNGNRIVVQNMNRDFIEKTEAMERLSNQIRFPGLVNGREEYKTELGQEIAAPQFNIDMGNNKILPFTIKALNSASGNKRVIVATIREKDGSTIRVGLNMKNPLAYEEYIKRNIVVPDNMLLDDGIVYNIHELPSWFNNDNTFNFNAPQTSLNSMLIYDVDDKATRAAQQANTLDANTINNYMQTANDILKSLQP